MRYLLKINLVDKKFDVTYNLNESILKDYLKVSNNYQSQNIQLQTMQYERKHPGLIEKNWDKPYYVDDHYFIFIGGYILFRNDLEDTKGYVPKPEDVLFYVNKHDDKIHNYLKGNYYIVIYNKDQNKIIVYSSPMFMHPAFYSLKNGTFIFSNFFEVFVKHHALTIDKQGILEFSLFDHAIHNKTIFNEVKQVPGGYKLDIKDEAQIKSDMIYDVANWYTSSPKERKVALEKINNQLKKSISTYVKNTDKLNIALTGGFDGRLNFSFIDGGEYGKINAISYGMPKSKQISIPKTISSKLKFKYSPIYLDESFENSYAKIGYDTIFLSGSVTGFNRANYPFAYEKIKDFSRSCLLGQCDMIRPLFGNPAGVIKNEFSDAVFWDNKEEFVKRVQKFKDNSFLDKKFFNKDIIDNIYDDLYNQYVYPYKKLGKNHQYYFFLLKESLMKYWQTEFHVVDLFVDDYVSYADLDYLEQLFGSKYAGIYKGLFAKKQIRRKRPHDLYIDLMKNNNNKLNKFYNDRGFKPILLKYGKLGWIIAGVTKQISKIGNKKDDTFNAVKWNQLFYQAYSNEIKKKSKIFDSAQIEQTVNSSIDDSGIGYRLNRAISLKIWLQKYYENEK